MPGRVRTLLVALLVACPLVGAPAGAQDPPSRLLRLAGPSRVETAVEVSRDQFADAGATIGLVAGAVLLARADAFPDAVAAGPLAVALRAPVLLTGQTSLHPATAEELSRVLAAGGRVILLGGTAALSEAVADDLRSLGYAVERLAGPTRYATSLAIARATTATPTQVWVADGNTFGDPLLAAAAAAAKGGTVVLANGTVLDDDVGAYVAEADEVRAVGPVAETLDMVATAHRYVGADTAERGALMLRDPSLWDLGSIPGVAVASGQDFPDGLAGGAHAGRLGMPLVLAADDTIGPVLDVLRPVAPLNAVVLYGGTAVLGPPVEAEARSLLGEAFADLAQGVSWQFVRHHTQVFTAQGSSPARESSTTVFTITLGEPTTVAGQTAYPVTIAGVDDPPVQWTHLAGSLDRLFGSKDGQTLLPIYDLESEWTGGGFFIRTDDVPTATTYDGSWANGVPALTVSRDGSSEECISLPGEAPICDADEESTTDFRREWFTPGIGPLGYSAQYVFSDCGGGFCTGFTSETTIDLMTANLQLAEAALIAPTWRFLTPPPTPVEGAGAVALGPNIHLLGGTLDRDPQPVMQIYDTTTDSWTVSGSPLPCDSYEKPAAVVLGDGLLLLTVCDGAFAAWRYDLTTDSWQERGQLDLNPPPFPSAFDALIATPDGALLLYGPSGESRFSIGFTDTDGSWYGGVTFNRTVVNVHPVGFAGTNMLAVVADPDELTVENWDLATGDLQILSGVDAAFADMLTGHVGDHFLMAAGRDAGAPRHDVMALVGPAWEDGVMIDLPGTVLAGPAAGAVVGDEMFLFQGERAEAYRPPG